MVFRFIKKILKRKTLFRFLTEESLLREFSFLKGNILDLASGASSYEALLPNGVTLIKTDLNPKDAETKKVDCNEILPFENNLYDGIIFINALYTLKDREMFIKEVYRVLKPGGIFISISPFIANEMPEPHDYCRLTYEGLTSLMSKNIWSSVRVTRIGERFSSSANLLHPVFLFTLVRVFFYGLALILDSLTPKRVIDRHPTPLGYTIVSVK
ncbi:MAG: class I SAM-dependent methyltransferase [Candidatus Paceibacterota bacterium]